MIKIENIKSDVTYKLNLSDSDVNMALSHIVFHGNLKYGNLHPIGCACVNPDGSSSGRIVPSPPSSQFQVNEFTLVFDNDDFIIHDGCEITFKADGAEYAELFFSPVREKYLFLDVDGVLATRRTYDKFFSDVEINKYDNECMFDDVCLNFLHYIIEKTNCFVVISSSWRKGDLERIKSIFSRRGFKYPERIIGETIRGYQFVEKGSHLPICRGNEIKAYIDKKIRYIDGKGFIKKNGVHFEYVIIDDASDMLFEQRFNFVRTKDGLTKDDADLAIKILTGKNPKNIFDYAQIDSTVNKIIYEVINPPYSRLSQDEIDNISKSITSLITKIK